MSATFDAAPPAVVAVWVGLALGLGLTLGVAYFGSLWLVVQRMAPGRDWAALLLATGIVRFTVLAAALAWLARQGSATLLALVLLGILLGREGLRRSLRWARPGTAGRAAGAAGAAGGSGTGGTAGVALGDPAGCTSREVSYAR